MRSTGWRMSTTGAIAVRNRDFRMSLPRAETTGRVPAFRCGIRHREQRLGRRTLGQHDIMAGQLDVEVLDRVAVDRDLRDGLAVDQVLRGHQHAVDIERVQR
jgi:hypothetical protein